MEYSNLFVCLMGIGTVFFGLICLIALTYAMSAIFHRKGTTVVPRGTAFAPVAQPSAAKATATPEMVAAVSAAIAEDLGTDISGFRITSIRRL